MPAIRQPGQGMAVTTANNISSAAEPTARSDRQRIIRIVGLVLVLLALGAAFGSFLVLTGQTTIEPTPALVRRALIGNGAIVLLLVAIVAWEVAGLVRARHQGRAAAKLHVRIVLLFGLVAALPAIITAVGASFTLDRGLDRWFADRTRAIIETSRNVARAYVEEHSRGLAVELLAIGNEFNRVAPDLVRNETAIEAYLSNQAKLRRLSAIQLLRGDGTILLEGQGTAEEPPPPPAEALRDAQPNEPALIAPGRTNLVGGLLKLASFEDAFLYLVRPIDPEVTRYVRLTEENAEAYRILEENRFGVQVLFATVFAGLALVVLLAAIWIGLGFANKLVSPIRQLIAAAREVSGGRLDVRVPVDSSMGDVASLGETFNNMTGQLKSQRDELLETNEVLDERRRFTEAVLAGVTPGVIGLDVQGRVTLLNASALALLDVKREEALGRPFVELVPELEELISTAVSRERRPRPAQVQIERRGEVRSLNARITSERTRERSFGFVLTLDDITDLAAAQRRSAWADVARRIAHEIKNPLTPIQLSAERIKRRYGRQIADDDREVFDQCTETIVRQVGDIRRMVDEFSSFARMPKPTIEARDLSDVVREAVFLQEVGNPAISITFDKPEAPVEALVDHRLISQALTNVIKNAAESVEAVLPERDGVGWVRTRLVDTGDAAMIVVEDNGKGLPQEDRDKLLEPYITHREKGTGLGLAIVRKVMEEHGGSIELLDRQDGPGAFVRLTLPKAGAKPATPMGEAARA